MEDTAAADSEGWLSILISSTPPSLTQWAGIVQSLLCHANSKLSGQIDVLFWHFESAKKFNSTDLFTGQPN